MRLLLPNAATRKRIVTSLEDFYVGGKISDYNRGVGILASFYQVKLPKTVWMNSSEIPLDHGACRSGVVTLIHPDSWHRRKSYNTCSKWVNTVLHELGHHVQWDTEEKANSFANRMMRGLGGTNGK